MTTYQTLLDVLDRLRAEAPATYTSYHPSIDQVDLLNAARSKAFLHFYLKVSFGLLEFAEREEYITEGANDGGIDAYFIDRESRLIYFLQSKFRTNERNFEAKSIEPEELLMMDISRILDGETASMDGQQYNSKVLRMARSIKEIDDIGRYKYKVVILANAKGVTKQKLQMLTGGFPTELIDYKTCYSQLLFPLISGTYYNAEHLRLSINLSDKSPGARISYTVKTELTECEITLVFVPTIEIAKTLFKYRNSILQYNPRSYLGHEGKNVNAAIRKSIETRHTNEFALFNNGITMLSDETYLNERIGKKDRAQLLLVNPQVINGGQTAYTLSVIYRENLDKNIEDIFLGKEVLLKVITFQSGPELSEQEKVKLIEDISRATNQQTTVTNADRRSNDTTIKEIQRRVFNQTGIFLERKRGEFSDGVREGYIREDIIIDRNLFFRAALVVQGRVSEAAKKKLIAKVNFDELLSMSEEMLEKCAFAIQLLREVAYPKDKHPARVNISLLSSVYFGISIGFKAGMSQAERNKAVSQVSIGLQQKWDNFISHYTSLNVRQLVEGKRTLSLYYNIDEYFTNIKFSSDLQDYTSSLEQDNIN